MSKVAWYDGEGKGWLRDIRILLHFPYTCWHLAYVVIGAALATEMKWDIMAWTMLAFFLAMGIGAHCLDELKGRPLKTAVPSWVLITAAIVSVLGAVIIGLVIGIRDTLWILPCVAIGPFLVSAYNLELGFFHRDEVFAAAWGAFPVITAFVAQENRITAGVIFVALGCLLLSLAQRTLSKQVRYVRRNVRDLTGGYEDADEYHHRVTRDFIITPPEQALKWMTWAIIIIAIAMLIGKLSL